MPSILADIYTVYSANKRNVLVPRSRTTLDATQKHTIGRFGKLETWTRYVSLSTESATPQLPPIRLDRYRWHANGREFSQIGNVDAGVDVDVESHPVSFFTPQHFEPKAINMFYSLIVVFAFLFTFTLFWRKLEKKGRILFRAGEK